MLLDFFNPNTICFICNNKTGLSKNKTKYGYICWNCSQKLLKHNIGIFNIRNFSVEELKNKVYTSVINNTFSSTEHLPKSNISIKSTSYNGFNFNYLSDKYVYIRNKLYDIHSIERILTILKESGELVNTTKTPKVFFERYLLIISILNELIPIENKLSFNGRKPSKLKKELQEKEILTVNDFLDRYYEDTLDKIHALKTSKAKQNRVYKFSNEIDEYSKYMTNDSLKKFTFQYEQLEKMFIN